MALRLAVYTSVQAYLCVLREATRACLAVWPLTGGLDYPASYLALTPLARLGVPVNMDPPALLAATSALSLGSLKALVRMASQQRSELFRRLALALVPACRVRRTSPLDARPVYADLADSAVLAAAGWRRAAVAGPEPPRWLNGVLAPLHESLESAMASIQQALAFHSLPPLEDARLRLPPAIFGSPSSMCSWTVNGLFLPGILLVLCLFGVLGEDRFEPWRLCFGPSIYSHCMTDISRHGCVDVFVI